MSLKDVFLAKKLTAGFGLILAILAGISITSELLILILGDRTRLKLQRISPMKFIWGLSPIIPHRFLQPGFQNMMATFHTCPRIN